MPTPPFHLHGRLNSLDGTFQSNARRVIAEAGDPGIRLVNGADELEKLTDFRAGAVDGDTLGRAMQTVGNLSSTKQTRAVRLIQGRISDLQYVYLFLPYVSGMPPDGYNSLTVSDEVMEQLALVMAEYDCDSWGDAIETATAIALERDEAQLAQILANQLSD